MIEFNEEEKKILSEITYKEKLPKGNIFKQTINYFKATEKIYKNNTIINESMTINQFFKLVIVEFVKSIDEK